MQSQVLGWLLSLIIGAVGGNVAGMLFKKLSLGRLGNSLTGIIGGGFGGILLGAALGPTGMMAWLGNVIGAIGGSIVAMAVISLAKPEK